MSKNRLRILVLIDRYLPIIGGAQKNVHQIATGLVQDNCEVTVLTRMVVPDLTAREIIDGVKVRRFSGGRFRKLSKLVCIVAFVRYLVSRRKDYDIVLCVPCAKLTDLLPAYLASLLTGKPYVIRTTSTSLYDSVLGRFSGSYAERLQRMLLPSFLWRRVLQKAETIVNQSEAVRSQGLKYGIDSGCVIPNGVSTDKYHPVDDAGQARIRQKLRLPEDHVVFINTGRYVDVKNQIAILRVAREFARDGFNKFLVVLLGATESGQMSDAKPSLLKYIHNNGLDNHIRIVDDAPNVDEYLQASDIFVFPTLHAEGMSNSLLEAMAVGLPVAASDMEQIACVFPEAYPYFFNPSSDKQLGSILSSLAESQELRASVGAGLTKHILENYALTASIAKYKSLLRRFEAA